VPSSELPQYLRLHHRDLTFEQTVEEARIYHSTMDGMKPKKAVRFVAEPDADPNVLLINRLKAIEGRLDKQGHPEQQVHFFVNITTESDSNFDVDDCPNVTTAVELASTRSTCRSATAVRESFRRSIWFPAASIGIYVELVPDFDAPVNRFTGPRPGFSRTRRGCLVCGTFGCHSNFHRQDTLPASPRSQSPGPGTGMRRKPGCYVCGRYGCHSANHPDQSRGPLPQRSYVPPPTGNQSQGNSARCRIAGSRTPSTDRPQSR